MYIFVSESDGLINLKRRDGWYVVLAYVSPESRRTKLERTVTRLRRESTGDAATKPQQFTDDQYAKTLENVGKLGGLTIAVAVDLGMCSEHIVEHHRNLSAEDALKQYDEMLHESGRQFLADTANAIRSLSPQFYIRLLCQARLFLDVIKYATLYYVGKDSRSLKYFHWRVGENNIRKTPYETHASWASSSSFTDDSD